jgi:hypothetical protein
LIRGDIVEILMDKVESVDIDQSILAQPSADCLTRVPTAPSHGTAVFARRLSFLQTRLVFCQKCWFTLRFRAHEVLLYRGKTFAERSGYRRSSPIVAAGPQPGVFFIPAPGRFGTTVLL